MTRCLCGATLEYNIMCNYTTEETCIFAGYCMSYNDTTKDTVAGECPFSNHHEGGQVFYVTLPNDTSELNSFMCSGLNRTGLLCSQCQQGLGPTVLASARQRVECFDKWCILQLPCSPRPFYVCWWWFFSFTWPLLKWMFLYFSVST